MLRSTSCGCTRVSAVASGSAEVTGSRIAAPAPTGTVGFAPVGAATRATSAAAGVVMTALTTAGPEGWTTWLSGWGECTAGLDGRARRGRRAS